MKFLIDTLNRILFVSKVAKLTIIPTPGLKKCQLGASGYIWACHRLSVDDAKKDKA